MSYLHPFTVDRQVTLDEQYGDAGVRSSSLPADEISAFDFVPADEAPTDAQLRAMHAEDCRRNAEAVQRWFVTWWQADIAGQSEASLVWQLANPVPASRTNGVDLTPLIVAELMLRSGGACGGPSRPVAPAVQYIPWNIHLSSRPTSHRRIPARAALGL